jgi:hypothetical protein
VRVWLVNLDDPDPLDCERPDEAGCVRAGRFDPDPLDVPVRAEPADQLGVTGGGRPEHGGAE